MIPPGSQELDNLWAQQNAEWRDPGQLAGHWLGSAETDPRLLEHTVQGAWWEVLAESSITLLITREYEHLVLAAGFVDRPHLSYMRLPHPSGLVADHERGTVHVASTRNPNQIVELQPVAGVMSRHDIKGTARHLQEMRGTLVPVRSRFFPGCLYMHDLALIGGNLYANSVGQNAVVQISTDSYHRVWWPYCIETGDGPLFEQNYIQLNSIAPGLDLESSYFSASADKVSTRRPGHKNFAVDKRGVVFSGATRRAVIRGLTRPHSARLHNERIWVDNSGYGEFGFGEDGRFVPALRLPGWTRGLCFHGNIAFVGTSRVIKRYRQYAPGIDVDASLCGVHAVDMRSGRVLGSLLWPYGNQIFAIDWVPSCFSPGFPFHTKSRRASHSEKILFYTFTTEANGKT